MFNLLKICYHSKSYKTKILIGLIFIFPLIFIWQGLDFTDFGYALSNYQQFGNGYEGTTGYSTWLTNATGGLWFFFFEEKLGALGIRLAGVFLVFGIITVCYKTIIKYTKISKRLLLIAFLIIIAFSGSKYYLNYNLLTVFFYCLAVYFFMNGLADRKEWYFILSGLFVGLNIFVRFPNILGISFFLVLIFYVYLEGWKWRKLLTGGLYFALGLISAVGIVLTYMQYTGQLNLYTAAIHNLLASSIDSDYNPINLVQLFIEDHEAALRSLIRLTPRLIIVMGLIGMGFAFFKGKINTILWVILITVAAVVSWDYILNNRTDIIIFITGLLYLILACKVFNIINSEKKERALCLLALIVLIITPLGSNNGIVNSVHGYWLAVPLAINVFNAFIERGYQYLIINLDRKPENISLKAEFTPDGINRTKFDEINNIQLLPVIDIRATFIFVLLCMLIFSTSYSIQQTYRDSLKRITMLHAIDHPLLRGIHTTRPRAEAVQGLVDVIDDYVEPGAYMLAYESIPMVHYLTETRPYLNNPWPDLYQPERLEAEFKKAKVERPQLPIVVRITGNTRSNDWPNSRLNQRAQSVANRILFDDFLTTNRYNVSWSNGFFEILIAENAELVPSNGY